MTTIVSLKAVRAARDEIVRPVRHELVFWHGTSVCNLPGILSEGLLPEMTEHGFGNCLTTQPEIALFFARLHTQLRDDPVDRRPVLIRIEGRYLHPDWCRAEAGCYEIGAYGNDMPGRRRSDLRDVPSSWEASLAETGCISYHKRIAVTPDMVHRDFLDVPSPDVAGLIEEMAVGAPGDDATIAALQAFRSKFSGAMSDTRPRRVSARHASAAA